MMREELTTIYYISHALADQLYRGKFGPLQKVTVGKSRGRKAKAEAKAGISKLLSWIAGLDASVTIEGEGNDSESAEIKESVEDRALTLLRSLAESDEVPDLTDALSAQKLSSLYYFHLPLKIIKRAAAVGAEIIIKVSYSSQRLEVEGSTSPQNWLSRSLLNSIIWESAKREDMGIYMSGILHPLSCAQREDGVTQIAAQFLIIGTSR